MGRVGDGMICNLANANNAQKLTPKINATILKQISVIEKYQTLERIELLYLR